MFQASLVARYLRSNEKNTTHDVFSDWMPPSVVQSKALDHWLNQISVSAAKLTGDEDFKSGVEAN